MTGHGESSWLAVKGVIDAGLTLCTNYINPLSLLAAGSTYLEERSKRGYGIGYGVSTLCLAGSAAFHYQFGDTGSPTWNSLPVAVDTLLAVGFGIKGGWCAATYAQRKTEEAANLERTIEESLGKGEVHALRGELSNAVMIYEHALTEAEKLPPEKQKALLPCIHAHYFATRIRRALELDEAGKLDEATKELKAAKANLKEVKHGEGRLARTMRMRDWNQIIAAFTAYVKEFNAQHRSDEEIWLDS